MKHVFTLLAFALLSSGLAQIPVYVPTDGLLTWESFDTSQSDCLTGGSMPCTLWNLPTDRFGFSALDTEGACHTLTSANSGGNEWTFSTWIKAYGGQEIGNLFRQHWDGGNWLRFEFSNLIFRYRNETYKKIETPSGQLLDGSWHFVVVRVSPESISMWQDGILVVSTSGDFMDSYDEPFTIGSAIPPGDSEFGGCAEHFFGAMDDIGVWERALTDQEILALYNAPAPTVGCTDVTACNYDESANVSDDSCLYQDACGECGGEGVLGCMDTNACNFDEAATCPSDGCIYFPVVDLGEDLITCEESVVLAAGNEGASYLWSNGETTSAIDVTQSGGYSVEVSVSSGLLADAVAIDGFQHIGSFEQSHYYVSEASILWEEAKINCELLGGHLVTISSEEENQLVWQGVYANGLNPGGSNNYQAWIGLYQNFDSPDYSEPAGGWEWVTGEPVVYSNWAPEEPNNTDQGYFVHMTDANGACTEGDDICGTWDDANISGNLQSAFYVLELPIQSSLCTSSDSVFVEFNHGSCFCGANAVWDESLGECVGEISPTSACGPGTYWDEEGQECIILMPSDTDFDGCVSMVDLLDLLTVFGTCVEVPWVCGDPLEYQGQTYSTIQIGEQCWFEDNLATSAYRNGEPIIEYPDGQGWASTGAAGGAYNNSSANASTYGFLYNAYAALDPRGVCPSGWSVPSDADWTQLEVELGMSPTEAMEYGWRGDPVGHLMKSSTAFNGSNDSGFNGFPGGARDLEGTYYVLGGYGVWWSSSLFDDERVLARQLGNNTDEVQKRAWEKEFGFSIRCIQDSE